jgi:hypothetical protein
MQRGSLWVKQLFAVESTSAGSGYRRTLAFLRYIGDGNFGGSDFLVCYAVRWTGGFRLIPSSASEV